MHKRLIYIYDIPTDKLMEIAGEMRMWNVQLAKADTTHVWVIGSEGAVEQALKYGNMAAGRDISVADDHKHQLTGKDLDFGL